MIDRPAGNFVITVPSTTAAIRTLYATEQIVVTGTLVVVDMYDSEPVLVPGTLVVDDDGVMAGGLVLSGTLTGAGNVLLTGPSSWTGGTVALMEGLEVSSGQTLTVSTFSQHVLTNTTVPQPWHG